MQTNTNKPAQTPEQIEALRAEVLAALLNDQHKWIAALGWADGLKKADAYVLTNEHHHLVDNAGRLLPGVPESVRDAGTRSRPQRSQWITATSKRSGETLRFACYPLSLRDYIHNQIRLTASTATWLAGQAAN